MPTREKPAQKQRLQIAEVAAKLVANDSVADYHAAKKKPLRNWVTHGKIIYR